MAVMEDSWKEALRVALIKIHRFRQVVLTGKAIIPLKR
jgi:hypothetical protein